ncbi:MAG: hypothetical protein HC886_17875 [Leptolyngbyaceae cyanobacterium SM1_1_3]|nr:hypothetical protein [Leptolyngbyaceae cyanobacterium SM1_1_3]NJN04231.1 hypothetical protein [Leptolyngbyaceae cyanobacterium RM1_1_2]NJO10503.1 hypothetical protein [Leptolyngbyaceae cyanobacterium SL_1_1]
MSTHDAANDTYDPHIVPAETAARKEREGENFKKTPHDQGKPNSEGYTVDSEGLINNFAVEPEMYVEEPGDLRQEQEAIAAERSEDMAEVNQTDEEGKLTSKKDERGKGPGVI